MIKSSGKNVYAAAFHLFDKKRIVPSAPQTCRYTTIDTFSLVQIEPL
jgi:hypothetical protein